MVRVMGKQDETDDLEKNFFLFWSCININLQLKKNETLVVKFFSLNSFTY
jgi:hypothetical protein